MDDFYTTIERNGKEFDLRVVYEYYPARRGVFDSLCGVRNAGPQLTPDEPAHIEIIKVIDRLTKSEFELTKYEEESIISKIFEEYENYQPDFETDDY